MIPLKSKLHLGNDANEQLKTVFLDNGQEVLDDEGKSSLLYNLQILSGANPIAAGEENKSQLPLQELAYSTTLLKFAEKAKLKSTPDSLLHALGATKKSKRKFLNNAMRLCVHEGIVPASAVFKPNNNAKVVVTEKQASKSGNNNNNSKLQRNRKTQSQQSDSPTSSPPNNHQVPLHILFPKSKNRNSNNNNGNNCTNSLVPVPPTAFPRVGDSCDITTATAQFLHGDRQKQQKNGVNKQSHEHGSSGSDGVPITCGHCQLSSAVPLASEVRPIDDKQNHPHAQYKLFLTAMNEDELDERLWTVLSNLSSSSTSIQSPTKTRDDQENKETAKKSKSKKATSDNPIKIDIDNGNGVDDAILDDPEKVAAHFEYRIGAPPWHEHWFRLHRYSEELRERKVANNEAAKARLASLQHDHAVITAQVRALSSALLEIDPVHKVRALEAEEKRAEFETNNYNEGIRLIEEHLRYLSELEMRGLMHTAVAVEESRRAAATLCDLANYIGDDTSRHSDLFQSVELEGLAALLGDVLATAPICAKDEEHEAEFIGRRKNLMNTTTQRFQCADCLLLCQFSKYCPATGKKHPHMTIPGKEDEEIDDTVGAAKAAMLLQEAGLTQSMVAGSPLAKMLLLAAKLDSQKEKEDALEAEASGGFFSESGSGNYTYNNEKSRIGDGNEENSLSPHVRQDNNKNNTVSMVRSASWRSRTKKHVPPPQQQENDGDDENENNDGGDNDSSPLPPFHEQLKKNNNNNYNNNNNNKNQTESSPSPQNPFLDNPKNINNKNNNNNNNGPQRKNVIPGINRMNEPPLTAQPQQGQDQNDDQTQNQQSPLTPTSATTKKKISSSPSFRKSVHFSASNNNFPTGSADPTNKNTDLSYSVVMGHDISNASPSLSMTTTTANAMSMMMMESTAGSPMNESVASGLGLSRKYSMRQRDRIHSVQDFLTELPDQCIGDDKTTEDVIQKHVTEILQCAVRRDTEGMRWHHRRIASLLLPEKEGGPNRHAPKSYVDPLLEMERMFVEWFAAMVSRQKEDAKIAAIGANRISSTGLGAGGGVGGGGGPLGTTQALRRGMMEDRVRKLQREARELRYSIAKRPKGRQSAADMDDDFIFEALALRVRTLQRKKGAMRSKIRGTNDENRALETRIHLLKGDVMFLPSNNNNNNNGSPFASSVMNNNNNIIFDSNINQSSANNNIEDVSAFFKNSTITQNGSNMASGSPPLVGLISPSKTSSSPTILQGNNNINNNSTVTFVLDEGKHQTGAGGGGRNSISNSNSNNDSTGATPMMMTSPPSEAANSVGGRKDSFVRVQSFRRTNSFASATNSTSTATTPPNKSPNSHQQRQSNSSNNNNKSVVSPSTGFVNTSRNNSVAGMMPISVGFSSSSNNNNNTNVVANQSNINTNSSPPRIPQPPPPPKAPATPLQPPTN